MKKVTEKKQPKYIKKKVKHPKPDSKHCHLYFCAIFYKITSSETWQYYNVNKLLLFVYGIVS